MLTNNDTDVAMPQTIVTIRIPLPPRHCRPGTRVHWAAKAKAIRSYRTDSCVAALAAIGGKVRPFVGMCKLSHYWLMAKPELESLGAYPPRYRPLDSGNAIAALKAAIDGIVDSGLLVSDSHKHLEWGKCELRRTVQEHKGESGVILVFEGEIWKQ